LIQTGQLTRFQVQRIAVGKGKSLTLDRYVLKDKIGAGGMGEVYLAEHLRMEREVAVKILPSELVTNQQLVERFHREARAAAKLNHPNIVTAFDATEHEGTHFLVMELG
jgi:serine/threonine protein kinase